MGLYSDIHVYVLSLYEGGVCVFQYRYSHGTSVHFSDMGSSGKNVTSKQNYWG